MGRQLEPCSPVEVTEGKPIKQRCDQRIRVCLLMHYSNILVTITNVGPECAVIVQPIGLSDGGLRTDAGLGQITKLSRLDSIDLVLRPV